MKDVAILTMAGAVAGLALGVWLPTSGEDRWLWSVAGGAAAYGSFALSGHWLSRLHGQPLGWVIGGPIGLTVGGAVWTALLNPCRDEARSAVLGGFTGLVGGLVCGSFLGGMAFYRAIRSGQCKERAEIIGTTATMLGVVTLGAGVVVLTLISVGRALP